MTTKSSLANTLPDAIADAQVIYPESDGKPMADNTRQFRWIVTIQGGLAALFRADPNVFVAGDLLWYPVEGRADIRIAPDVLVVFGRPKGDRGSYLQWREEGIPPQVVFEVLSPANSTAEMNRKLKFYDRHGVEEYYLYDPDSGALDGWRRAGERLVLIDDLAGWVSPRLGVRFEFEAGELRIYRPDGKRFLTFEELEAERALAEQRAEQERQRAERLAAQLRELGVEPQEE